MNIQQGDSNETQSSNNLALDPKTDLPVDAITTKEAVEKYRISRSKLKRKHFQTYKMRGSGMTSINYYSLADLDKYFARQ